MPATTPLTRRALNRATLARQLLLEREKLPVLRAVERLVGLQAQLPRPPFLGLWSRLEGFQRESLTRLLHERKVVRATALRGTLHLMTAKDYLALRASLQPMLTQATRSVLRERMDTLDVPRLVAEARRFFDEQPRSFEVLRDHLLELHPKGDERAMGYAIRMELPLIQVPTDTEWGYPGTSDFAVAETWLGEPPGADEGPQALVLRHLASCGPATAADVQAWSGLGGLKEVMAELRPKLRVFQDERGRELFDLPKAPRPPEDTPAPVRFLPDFDNLTLSHDDRARWFLEDAHRKRLATSNLRVLPVFLVDGFVAGSWKLERKKGTATLVAEPFEPLTKKVRAELTEEGEALLRFAESEARAFEVRFA